MTALVHALQWLTAVVWLVPAGLLLPKFVRVMRGTGKQRDALRLPMFFLALLQVGYSARWLLWPHAMPAMHTSEMAFWGGLYVGSLGLAVWIVRTHLIIRKMP